MAGKEKEMDERRRAQDNPDQKALIPKASLLFSGKLPKRAAIVAAATRLAGLTKGSVSAGVFEAYADNLEDFDVSTLARIFEQAERTCKFFPVPAELREMAGIGGQGEGLAAWEFLQKILDTHVQRSGAEGYALCEGVGKLDLSQWAAGKEITAQRIPVPEIPPAIERAVRLCGGWARFKECGEEEYQWLKKEFLAAVASYDSTTMASGRLGAASVLAQIGAGGVKSLPAAPGPLLPAHVDPYSPAVYESAAYGPMETPEPVPLPAPRMIGAAMTEADWEARKRELRQQAAEIEDRRKVGGE